MLFDRGGLSKERERDKCEKFGRLKRAMIWEKEAFSMNSTIDWMFIEMASGRASHVLHFIECAILSRYVQVIVCANVVHLTHCTFFHMLRVREIARKKPK